MDDQKQAAQRWAEALSAPTEQNKAALAELLAENAVSVSPIGNAEGKVAILAGLEAQRIGTHPGDQRLRQSMSLAVSKKATARAN